MATEQHPRLLRSGLTGRVYVVTRYKELGDGRFESLEKFDVTDDFQAAGWARLPEPAGGCCTREAELQLQPEVGAELEFPTAAGEQT